MDLESCKLEIIERGFPEIRTLAIATEYRKMSDAYFEFIRLSRKNYTINVDNSLRNAKREVILGGMSHEIAHVSKEASRGLVLSFFDGILYNNFRWYEMWDERKTDLLVVKRGFGLELLAFLKYANKRREAYTAQDGLTVKELEILLQQK
jgi:hypothetical protein